LEFTFFNCSNSCLSFSFKYEVNVPVSLFTSATDLLIFTKVLARDILTE
jgi:hypothetical protein